VRTPGIRLIRSCALAALLVAAGTTSAGAQVPAPDAAQACVYQPNIDHTRILDDRNILFFMRNHTTYQNTLKDQCYSLKMINRFTYGEAPMHRLCTGNLITVLHDLTPGGVTRNNLCRLGMFVPVDDDVVDDLIAAAESPRKGRGKSIAAAPVELPAATESRADAIEARAQPLQPQPAPAAAPEPAAEPGR
jgi:hypothetical protein